MGKHNRRLCLIICAAGPAGDAATLIDLAQADGVRTSLQEMLTANTSLSTVLADR